ncbi:MAG: endo-1,4-beta-xylanase [Phycisphaerae bacterium]
MLRFSVYDNGGVAQRVDLNGSYLVGSDGVPLRAEIEFRDGEIVCTKRAPGPAGLALLWPVKGCGRILLESARLPERDKPYNLHLELARGRLMRIDQKREEWGLFDFPGMEELNAQLKLSREYFVRALQADSPAEVARWADQALQSAIVVGERISLFHADIFLSRRRQTHAFNRRPFGCVLDPSNTSEPYYHRIREAFDFVNLPMLWKHIEPKEQEINWTSLDAWVDWLTRHRVPITAGPLVSFQEGHVPDWLFIYEHDYDAIRGMVFEHVRRVVERYGRHVQRWVVVGGVHATNPLHFNFEQLMELTRVAATLVKQLAPRAASIVELISPWGEYYSRNQRTIPPMLYADMAVQSGIGFDAFGLQFQFGPGLDGMFVRDMFQISSMIDRVGNLGKPVHVTAAQVPGVLRLPGGGGSMVADGGTWRQEWNEEVQAAWLKEFYQTALSKPFVETVTWRDLADEAPLAIMPNGGLIRADHTPKSAFKMLLSLRHDILGASRKPPRHAETT